MDTQGFYDLNLSVNAFNNPERIMKKLTDFGYRTVAVNYVIEESALESKPKKKRKASNTTGVDSDNSSDIVPSPKQIDIPQNLVKKLKVLNRLTVEFSHPDQLVKIRNSENVKKYHLFAVIPKTENALQRTCISLDVDIISFPPLEKPIRFNRKMYNLAVAKNVYFEIPYSLAISSSSARRITIQTAHMYHVFGKSKNVIMTSGAEDLLQLRAPYDVINLGLLFGLSDEQSKNAINRYGREALLKGDGRRHGNSVMTIQTIQDEGDCKVLNLPIDEHPTNKILKKAKLDSTAN